MKDKDKTRETALSDHSPVQGGTETVLLAEDDEVIRRLCRDTLEKFGYTVIVAEDGGDAVRKFMENKDEINLLLLDVIMPKKSGIKVYENIKEINPDIKILFLSGYPSDLLQMKDILKEGLNFMSKPVSADDLLRNVRAVLDT